MNAVLPVERFLFTLDIVAREKQHLCYSWKRLYSQTIDTRWVERLEEHPELAEQLEAFVSRFGRMQDTIADKLLPRWLMALAERPGSQIETLNRAERLGVIDSVEGWLEARKLRNRLVHEYVESAEVFAEDLQLAKEYSALLVNCFDALCKYAHNRMNIERILLPNDAEL
ncbi:MAG: hypothetical protein ABW166_14860 [Sedimenticola sp.]